MIICIGDNELEKHDGANIPCNLFISEIDEDYEEEVAAALEDREDIPEGFEAKWILTGDNFMPRKGLWDGCIRYVSDTKEELHQLVKEKILPTYKIAFDAVTDMAEGRRKSFYYWDPKGPDVE